MHIEILFMRLLIALGGNAIKQAGEKGTTKEQFRNCETTAKFIAQIVKKMEKEDRLIITHGNGPQVGNLMVQQESIADIPAQRMDIIGAMTQGQIGYMIQQSLINYLNDLRIKIPVCTVITQVIVNRNDPEFFGKKASKPVGNFFNEEEVKKLKEVHPDYIIKKVNPAGEKCWRRVVPSPLPVEHVECECIRRMVDSGIIVIASGGGGIPVVLSKAHYRGYRGIEAVVDKDLAAEKLAEIVGVDTLLMLTNVENVKLNYGKENEKKISEMTLTDARKYLQEGQFLKGSMEPKVKACIKFLERGGKLATITSLDRAVEAMEGKSGTRIIPIAQHP